MAAPLIAQIGVPVLIDVLSEILGGMDNQAAKTASKALNRVDEALKSGAITPEQLAEANRHAERMSELEREEYRTAISEVNQSLRAEVATEDKYVRRMRPTFGYLMALTWAAQMFVVAYVIVFETDKAGVVLAAMGSLSAIWAVGLSVLGIYVYKRSEDKLLSAPQREVIFWNPQKKGKE
ncbi:MAG: ribokinase [Rhodospirillales bacterium]|nr:ribokinase [Rhodospirillales bacterium]